MPPEAAAAIDRYRAPVWEGLPTVTGSTWAATVLAAGAVISIFSVTLVAIYGSTRILSRWAATR
ncbi:MAG TPA: hypothetical protein VN213_12025 [Solirubrobacteraceae bacterium]|nr:hypothetical protein [Solirubrobacteraceae bacterium]